MPHPNRDTPTEVLLLADHLDAVLAAGEDIMKLEVDIEAVRKSDGVAAPWERFSGLVAQAKIFELTIVSRTLQARVRAREVAAALRGRDEAGIPLLLDLFVGGTAVFEDTVAELANRTGADFDAGLDPMAYLRTRGFISAEAGTLAGVRKLAVGETFLVARQIELGPLLDMAAALLDALDAVYCLFEAEAQERTPAAEPLADTVTSQDLEPSRHSAGS